MNFNFHISSLIENNLVESFIKLTNLQYFRWRVNLHQKYWTHPQLLLPLFEEGTIADRKGRVFPFRLVRFDFCDQLVHVTNGAHALYVFAHGWNDWDVMAEVCEVETLCGEAQIAEPFHAVLLFSCILNIRNMLSWWLDVIIHFYKVQ